MKSVDEKYLLERKVLQLEEEVAKYRFLHNLDHSLADQWRAKLDLAESKLKMWEDMFAWMKEWSEYVAEYDEGERIGR